MAFGVRRVLEDAHTNSADPTTQAYQLDASVESDACSSALAQPQGFDCPLGLSLALAVRGAWTYSLLRQRGIQRRRGTHILGLGTRQLSPRLHLPSRRICSLMDFQ